ncbi:MAG: type II toxin-antitoxin system VapC family toxin [Chloroflexi bacterium]|nr:type II toxin-antitoxin system VapC family toxin [Chloroflexota bacterium]
MTYTNKTLQQFDSVFLDTAPVIYYVERKQPFYKKAELFFSLLDDGAFTAVSSPITLAECLFYPYKQKNEPLLQAFQVLLISGPNTIFVPATALIANLSARLRANYNLGFADAFQVATAIHAGCDAFLTNDKQLQRIAELKVVVLENIAVEDTPSTN